MWGGGASCGMEVIYLHPVDIGVAAVISCGGCRSICCAAWEGQRRMQQGLVDCSCSAVGGDEKGHLPQPASAECCSYKHQWFKLA